MPIPKKIHYVWFGGQDKKPPLFFRCLQSWRKFCPDYEITEWNESNFDLSESPFALQAYRAGKYAFAADYARVCVLEKYGGIYLDTDAELTKPLDALLDLDAFISFENKAHLQTAVIGATPHHEFFATVLDFYRKINFDDYSQKTAYLANTLLFTYFMKRDYRLKLKDRTQFLQNTQSGQKFAVFAQDYFSPLNYTSGKLKQTKNTHAVHWFSASWFSKSQKTGAKVLRVLYYAATPLLFNLFAKIAVAVALKKIKNISAAVRRPLQT